MQFKGVNNKERQQYPRSEVSLKRMRISAVCHPCGVGLAVRGVLSASVAESSRHLALPPSLPLFLSTVFQCDGCLFLSLVRGGSWLGCSVVPAMGALFSLGAGCQKWKPLDIPGTQPPLSDAVVNWTWSVVVNLCLILIQNDKQLVSPQRVNQAHHENWANDHVSQGNLSSFLKMINQYQLERCGDEIIEFLC